MRSASPVALALAAAALLAGCGDGGARDTSRTPGDVIRAEAGCALAGLPSPLRRTTVFLDARAIRPSTGARDFAEKNGPLRDLILSIAEPGRIGSSGLTALRERVSIAVVPPDGSAAQLLFTGCPPGLSTDELAAARKGGSAVAEFFTGDTADRYAKQADAFAEQLIGALNAAGARAAGGSPEGSIAGAPFLSGVKASRALLDAPGVAHRLVLVSDLAAFDAAGDFAAGLAAGQASGDSFGLAEAHLVVPAGRPVAHEAWLRGWLLGQGAQLVSAGSGRLGASGPPPRRLLTYSGEAAYPSRTAAVTVRLGDDGAGKLAGSWLVVRGSPDKAVPMTGTIACSAPDRCTVKSDEGGFAQAWGGGGPLRYDNDWPFAGLRRFELELRGRDLNGRVFDDGVTIDGRGGNGIAVTARRQDG